MIRVVCAAPFADVEGTGGGPMEDDGAADEEAGPVGGAFPRSARGPVGTPWYAAPWWGALWCWLSRRSSCCCLLSWPWSLSRPPPRPLPRPYRPPSLVSLLSLLSLLSLPYRSSSTHGPFSLKGESMCEITHCDRPRRVHTATNALALCPAAGPPPPPVRGHPCRAL